MHRLNHNFFEKICLFWLCELVCGTVGFFAGFLLALIFHIITTVIQAIFGANITYDFLVGAVFVLCFFAGLIAGGYYYFKWYHPYHL